MESSEREPSYYEVALTHRQVMVGLVVALTTVVVAFFAGIWIGRDRDAARAAAADRRAASAPATPEVETLTFFGDKQAATAPKTASKPAPIAPPPTRVAPAEDSPGSEAATPERSEAESAKLRQTLEAEMAANRVDGAESPAVVPGARVTRSPQSAATTAAAKPEVTPAATSGTLWIQVYSSTNAERAKEISTGLVKSGFPVRTLEPGAATGANYRVRVGPYPDRARAERVATRLRRELKLDTWITESP